MADEWDLYAVVRSCTAATINTNNLQEEEHFSNVSSMTFQNDDNSFLYPRQGLDEIYNPYQINPITPFLGGFENIKQQQERELKNSGADASFTFSPTNSETIRSRRRKNQQMKTVSQMTQEELSSDSWAWRKYGQKPIKGSPYPRNYYRCSTSKGCAARKQVERSPTDPTIFVVSYTGEHTHPRPTHRSSLAGTTRTKYNKNSSGDGDCSIAAAKPSCSSSPPASASSFSPTNPLKEAMDVEMVVLVQEEEDDDDDILIPNTVMTEEIFKGFEELGGGKGWSTTNNGFDSNG